MIRVVGSTWLVIRIQFGSNKTASKIHGIPGLGSCKCHHKPIRSPPHLRRLKVFPPKLLKLPSVCYRVPYICSQLARRALQAA